MKSNLDLSHLDDVALLAKAIREWIGKKSRLELYADVKESELVRDFVYTLDLLETVLIHFEISVHLAKLALEQLEDPARIGSLGREFLQIDIEEFFASNLLDLCYILSNAWKKIQGFADKDKAFKILQTEPQQPSIENLLARHKVTHFEPLQFESHRVASKYSILRRPYQSQDGKLKKELAKETMPRVANLVQGAVQEALDYLNKFREATIG